MPEISIIVPVYKVEKYLNRCIESILKQTFTDYEVILVDDGSPDNCPQICDDWEKRDGRIRVVHKENGGLSDARNVGLELAKGKYIFFIDSDDYIIPEMLEKLDTAMEKKENRIVIMDVLWVWEDREKIQKSKIYGKLSRDEALHGIFEGRIPNYAHGRLFSKKLWENIRFPVGKTFEDIATIYKVFNKSENVVSLEDYGYCYVQREGSITDRALETRLDAVEAYKKQLDFVREYNTEMIPYLEYRVEETKARYVVLKYYGKEPWGLVKKMMKPYRVWIKKHLLLVCSGKLEPVESEIRNLSIFLALILPRAYAVLYGKYVEKKAGKKNE